MTGMIKGCFFLGGGGEIFDSEFFLGRKVCILVSIVFNQVFK